MAVSCPKCRSQEVIVGKKGFGAGKAVIGALLVGPLGLALGAKGSKKVVVNCVNCGHEWEPGKPS